MRITVNTKYLRDQKATVYKGKYGDGSIALVLEEYGERLAVATVNLEAYDEHPAEGNVFIKDYSENEGMLDSLYDQRVISRPVRVVTTNFITVFECTLIGDPKELT